MESGSALMCGQKGWHVQRLTTSVSLQRGKYGDFGIFEVLTGHGPVGLCKRVVVVVNVFAEPLELEIGSKPSCAELGKF